MFKPLLNGSEIAPFPSLFVAKTVIVRSVEGEQDDEELSNT